MKKAKRVTLKKLIGKNPVGNDVYWYGIHIHHIGLGVAALGTLIVVLLI